MGIPLNDDLQSVLDVELAAGNAIERDDEVQDRFESYRTITLSRPFQKPWGRMRFLAATYTEGLGGDFYTAGGVWISAPAPSLATRDAMLIEARSKGELLPPEQWPLPSLPGMWYLHYPESNRSIIVIVIVCWSLIVLTGLAAAGYFGKRYRESAMIGLATAVLVEIVLVAQQLWTRHSVTDLFALQLEFARVVLLGSSSDVPMQKSAFSAWRDRLREDVRAGRLYEASMELMQNFSRHLGQAGREWPWFEEIAQEYAALMRRCAADGDRDSARNARDRAIFWMRVQAARGAEPDHGRLRPVPALADMERFAARLRSELGDD